MVRVPSNMVSLGTPAADFCLQDAVSHEWLSLENFSDAKALLVVFMCNHCPFVKHIRDKLAALGRDYHVHLRGDKAGLAMVGINSNDTSAHPDDAPEKMAREAVEAGYTFPYLFDATQEVAKKYRAACTPDFYLFDDQRKLVYRGQFDDSRPGNNIPVTGSDLRSAIDAVLAGRGVREPQRASLGCNIKWKPGFEPDYFQ
jgi:thiol-disulfide isomerase/thioredoxin